jgi:hypothetical protein
LLWFWVKASDDERANNARMAMRERNIDPPMWNRGLLGGKANRPAAAGVGAVLYHGLEVCHKSR